jgi:hypothetical protein
MVGALRIAAVLAVALWGVLGQAFGLQTLIKPVNYALNGQFLIDVRPPDDTRVWSVVANAPDGFRVGDQFSAASLSFADRLRLYGYTPAAPGDRLDVTVLRDGRRERLHVPAVPVNVLKLYGADQTANTIVGSLAGLTALAIAAALVLLRPGAMMWGLYLYIALNILSGYIWLQVPGIVNFTLYTLNLALAPLGAFAGIQFCARFPTGAMLRSGRIVTWIAAVPAVLLAVAAAVRNADGVLYPIASLQFLSDAKSSAFLTLWTCCWVLLAALALVAMGLRYRALDPPDRLKVRAVFASIALYGGVTIAESILQHFTPYHDTLTALDEVEFWASNVYVLVPATALYAVLHHRMFDVRFVASRAVVYGVLTLAFVSVLRLITFLVSRQLSESKLAVVGLAITLAFAFSLERLKALVESALRGVLYRARDRALAELARIERVVEAAARAETIDGLLVGDVPGVLHLTSAAVFRLDGTSLRRVAASGWGDDAAATIAADGLLAVELRDGRRPIRIDRLHVRGLALPDGQATPAVALPLMRRHELLGIVFYGGHESGGDVEPEEIAALRSVADAAAATYDHLETLALRAELAALRA